jgi:hypothetical protein
MFVILYSLTFGFSGTMSRCSKSPKPSSPSSKPKKPSKPKNQPTPPPEPAPVPSSGPESLYKPIYVSHIVPYVDGFNPSMYRQM